MGDTEYRERLKCTRL